MVWFYDIKLSDISVYTKVTIEAFVTYQDCLTIFVSQRQSETQIIVKFS